jgi:hypothetical protein
MSTCFRSCARRVLLQQRRRGEVPWSVDREFFYGRFESRQINQLCISPVTFWLPRSPLEQIPYHRSEGIDLFAGDRKIMHRARLVHLLNEFPLKCL